MGSIFALRRAKVESEGFTSTAFHFTRHRLLTLLKIVLNKKRKRNTSFFTSLLWNRRDYHLVKMLIPLMDYLNNNCQTFAFIL
jgi:hypothetical protein